MGELSNNQRVLKLREIFMYESDENHKLSLENIHDKMSRSMGEDFYIDNRSIQGAISTLSKSGFNVDCEIGKQNKKLYYHADRDFELYELRMLIDAVSSAKFITVCESEKLIEKLKKQTSHFDAAELESQIILDSKLKCENRSVRFFIDKIHKAIGNNYKIKFQYGCYDVNKNFNLRKEGKIYSLFPYALIWSREFYYIIGIHEGKDDFSHYRIDKMRNVEVAEEKFRRLEFNAADYLNKTFNMYGGIVETVKLSFSNELINYVLDRFGRDVEVTRRNQNSFEIVIEAAVSDGLLKWILNWGRGCRVISPASLRERVLEEIRCMQDIYQVSE
jgi:predicted DNA-binding transcriptional regulator YafY